MTLCRPFWAAPTKFLDHVLWIRFYNIWYKDKFNILIFQDLWCCLVTKSCLTLSNSVDWSTPGFIVFHYLPEFAQNSYSLSWWCYITISSSVTPISFCLSQYQGFFQWIGSLHQVAKVLEFQPQHQSFQ